MKTMPKAFYTYFILSYAVCRLVTVVAFMTNQTNFMRTNEMQCLTQLPVEQLLKIRKTLQLFKNVSSNEIELNDRIGVINDEPIDTISMHMNDKGRQNIDIIASPLIGTGYGHNIRNKVGYPENDHEQEKQTKIKKIFNLSVTALAFLAFGGYLLCMIVQAIKYKGTTYFHPTLLPMTAAVQSTTQKRRPSTRYRRNINRIQAMKKKNETNASHKMAEPSPDDLFKVLVLAAESYVHLNQF